MILRQLHLEKPLVVPQVEVGLPTIGEDENLSVLKGGHRPGVDVEVRVDLDGRHSQAARLEHPTDGRDGNALAEARHYASSNDDTGVVGGKKRRR